MANIDLTQAQQLPNATVLRYRDMGDGTHALVLAIGPLPAGGANIGNVDVATLPALIAGDANIGNVDVVTLPSLVTGDATIGRVLIIDAAGTLAQFDSTNGALETVDYPHGEIHAGRAFMAWVIDTGFDKSDEISISFRTPDTTRWLHVTPLAICATFATFDILRGPTITAGTGTPGPVDNRNENSANNSGVWSVAAVPVQSEMTRNATIAADGYVLHREVLGGGKNRSGTMGESDREEIELLRNTIYTFRLKGTGTGSDAQVGGVHLSWYGHVNL